MVFAHMTSKEIARELDISPHTVDQRLKTAMRVLGVTSRIEAACILHEHEAGEPYQSLVYQSPELDAPPPTGAIMAASTERDTQHEQGGYNIREPRATYQALADPPPSFSLPPQRIGGKYNDLTTLQRLGVVAAIMIGAALAFGGVIAGLEVLTRFI